MVVLQFHILMNTWVVWMYCPVNELSCYEYVLWMPQHRQLPNNSGDCLGGYFPHANRGFLKMSAMWSLFYIDIWHTTVHLVYDYMTFFRGTKWISNVLNYIMTLTNKMHTSFTYTNFGHISLRISVRDSGHVFYFSRFQPFFMYRLHSNVHSYWLI